MRLAAISTRWLLTATLVCQLGSNAFASDGWRSDFEAARQEAVQSGKPLLVHFSAEWCGPCRQMESTVFNQPQVVRILQQDIVAVKLDVDHHKALSSRFGIESLPCDIFLEPGGDRIVESTGYRGVSEYVEMLQRAKTRNTELARLRQQRANTSVAAATPAASADASVAPTAEANAAAMLDGYCPVTLWKSRKWIKGSSELTTDFRGQTYHFSTAEAMDTFKQDPRRYTPRFLGCDAVSVWESDRAVRGQTRFAAFYDDELYLFSNAENRDTFKQNPDRYIRTRIVLQPDEIETVVR
ncbi:MAG: thioredoxin family protein [Planctomycetaceae bacterium]|nr:thioredoxin family protein [Planctomycetaceae bacterium]